MESWLSGRRRTTGNRVYVNSVTRVQIPNSPPTQEPPNMVVLVVYTGLSPCGLTYLNDIKIIIIIEI